MKTAMLHISPDRLVGEIQHEFSGAYPFLSLEFYKPRLLYGRYSSPGEKIGSDKKLVQAMKSPGEGTVEITDNTTTKHLEKDLREHYGLFVKMYRKSGNLWMKITLSDDWTLKQQNEHGKELSSQHKGQQGEGESYNYESGIY